MLKRRFRPFVKVEPVGLPVPVMLTMISSSDISLLLDFSIEHKNYSYHYLNIYSDEACTVLVHEMKWTSEGDTIYTYFNAQPGQYWARARTSNAGESEFSAWSNVLTATITGMVEPPVYDSANHSSRITSAISNSLNFYVGPIAGATNYAIRLFDYEANTTQEYSGLAQLSSASERYTISNLPDSTRFECLFRGYNSSGTTAWIPFKTEISNGSTHWENTKITKVCTPSATYQGLVNGFHQIRFDWGCKTPKPGAKWAVSIYTSGTRLLASRIYTYRSGLTYATVPVPVTLGVNANMQQGVRYYYSVDQSYTPNSVHASDTNWNTFEVTHWDSVL